MVMLTPSPVFLFGNVKEFLIWYGPLWTKTVLSFSVTSDGQSAGSIGDPEVKWSDHEVSTARQWTLLLVMSSYILLSYGSTRVTVLMNQTLCGNTWMSAEIYISVWNDRINIWFPQSWTSNTSSFQLTWKHTTIGFLGSRLLQSIGNDNNQNKSARQNQPWDPGAAGSH